MNWKPSRQAIWGFVVGIIVAVFLFQIGLTIFKTYRAVWENRAALVQVIERVNTLEGSTNP